MKIQYINILLLFTFINSTKINAMNKKKSNLQAYDTMLPHTITSLTSKEEKIYQEIISEQEYVNNNFPYIFLLEENKQSSIPFITAKNLPHSYYCNGNPAYNFKLLSAKYYSLFPASIDK